MEWIKEYIDSKMKVLHSFDVKDVALFKICLVLFGMLTAISAPKTAKLLKPILWFGFWGSFLYLVYRFFLQDELEEEYEYCEQ